MEAFWNFRIELFCNTLTLIDDICDIFYPESAGEFRKCIINVPVKTLSEFKMYSCLPFFPLLDFILLLKRTESCKGAFFLPSNSGIYGGGFIILQRFCHANALKQSP